MNRRLLKVLSVLATIMLSLFTIFWFIAWTAFFDDVISFQVAMLLELIGYVLTLVLLYVTISLSDVPPLSSPHGSFLIGFISGIPIYYNDKEDEIKFGSL